MSLDAHQRAAVAHGEGPALVLAGPGSGKTRVIVERAVRLLERPHDPGLLVLTFSRRAAAELRERIAARLHRSHASFPVTTFHAFCFGLLTRDAADPPRLAKPAERRELMRDALAAEGDLGLRPSTALTDEALAFAALCDDYLVLPDHPLAAARTRYVEALAARNALDYGGLQREAVELLRREAGLRAECAARYRSILVDEYQDTNVAQDALLGLIAGEHRNVFCVADEDQSIYGFRGAEIDNTLEFERRWPAATVYPLPTNYRSAPAIVGLARTVVAHNVETHRHKELEPADPERPAVLARRTFRHAAEEADWVAREIARLRRDGVPLGEIAVLVRSLRELGPRLAYALGLHEIAFHAPLAPTLHPTADALLSLLELAEPDRWDRAHEEQALRTLASPLFRADALELRAYRRESRSFYGALRASDRFDAFFEALAIVRRQRAAGGAVWALWQRLDAFRELERRCRPLDASRDALEELGAVTALSDAANELDGAAPADFARAYRAGALADEDWLPRGPLPADAVALLTVHQAKGLEWEAVFVCDLVEGRFPALSRSQHALFDRDLFAAIPRTEAERVRRALEEERRLFYVALTRARTRLTLTATEEGREESGRSLSRFYLEAEPLVEPARDDGGFVSAAECLAALRRSGGGPPGWRQREETPGARAMLPDGGLRTSATGLAPYENCPLQFYLGTMLELVRPSGAALVLGGVLHDVLEAYHDDGELTHARLRALARQKWRAGAIRPAPLEAEQRRKLERMLDDYFMLEVAPGLDAEILAVEQRFRVQIDATTLAGRIDRIDRLADGRLRLLDYKSGKAMGKREAEEDLQLALYAVAVAREPELAALGEVGELVYLFPAHRANQQLARRTQPVTADLVARTEARIRGLVAQIAAERFDHSPEADCGFCEFKDLCPRHHGGAVPL